MLRGTRGKLIRLRKDATFADGDAAAEPHSALEALHTRSPRSFPSVSTMPRLLLTIPDEILDYFGWVFCQGGFSNLHMTFEQFLAVVAKVSPAALCPEYDAAEAGLSEGTR
jgi:hypothetical protein